MAGDTVIKNWLEILLLKIGFQINNINFYIL